MDVRPANALEDESNNADSTCNSSISFGTMDVSNLEMRSDTSHTSFGSRRSAQEPENGYQRLNLATDIVLIISAAIIIVSLVFSLGIFIFGQYRIFRGLEYFALAFEDGETKPNIKANMHVE